jgi:hypothetical protein
MPIPTKVYKYESKNSGGIPYQRNYVDTLLLTLVNPCRAVLLSVNAQIRINVRLYADIARQFRGHQAKFFTGMKIPLGIEGEKQIFEPCLHKI